MTSLARFRFEKSAGSAMSRSSCSKRSRLRSMSGLKSMVLIQRDPEAFGVTVERNSSAKPF